MTAEDDNKITYKGITVVAHGGLSLNLLKALIDELGDDYSFTLQDVIDFIVRHKSKLTP